MGVASNVISVTLRLVELATSVVVIGIIGYFITLLEGANAYADARIIYGLVIASMSAFVSIVLMLPFLYAFLAFPVDIIFFVLWLVAFCLLVATSGNNACNSVWYYSYWGYYWGGFWRTPVIVTSPNSIGWAGCSSWRTVLAMSFIASFFYLASSCLGCYVVLKYRDEKIRRVSPVKPWTGGQPQPMQAAPMEPGSLYAQAPVGNTVGAPVTDSSRLESGAHY